MSEFDNEQSEICKCQWVSPSDLLIDKVELKPPLTSRYMRGEAHKGILTIGDEFVEKEYDDFYKRMKTLLTEDDETWKYIIASQKDKVSLQAKKMEEKVFSSKSKIMATEFSKFYESSLQELEQHIRTELEQILVATHAEETSRMNIKIKKDLEDERLKLEKELQVTYDAEIKRMREYYYLLHKREKIQATELINKAVFARDEVLAMLYRQLEMKNMSGSMYVMCSERKKCHIENYLLQNYWQRLENEELQKLFFKGKQVADLQEKCIRPDLANKQWQDKICKILKLFLKFISYSLKLLPEQTSFLLHFERMVVLQLNEIINSPGSSHSSLEVNQDLVNKFSFIRKEDSELYSCKKPFVIYGDLSNPEKIQYGSRETLPLDVDLPVIVVDEKYFYARCERFEDIKLTLQCKCKNVKAICRCKNDLSSTNSESSQQESKPTTRNSLASEDEQFYDYGRDFNNENKTKIIPQSSTTIASESPDGNKSSGRTSQDSVEQTARACDAFSRIDYCPNKSCGHWLKLVAPDDVFSFDYDENIMKKLRAEIAMQKVEEPKKPKFNATFSEPTGMPASKMKDDCHASVEIQCSLEELTGDEECPCCKFESKTDIDV